MTTKFRLNPTTSKVTTLDAIAAVRANNRAKLTPVQRVAVKSLVVDEGYTRAEAVAWVLAFGVSP
jgi:hypothetical protein